MAKRRDQGSGTVYWDPARQRWIGQVWIGGRRRKVSAKTKLDASAALGRLLHGDDPGRLADRSANVRGLLDDWQAKVLTTRALAPSTLRLHQWFAAMWTDEVGHVKVADLNVFMIEAGLARFAKGAAGRRPMAKASLIKARSTLSQALAWGVRRRLLSFNAAAIAELPSTAVPPTTRRALTRSELDRLLAELEGHPLEPMYRVMGRVGLRPGEAAGLCSDALDLDGNPPTIAVVRAVQYRFAEPHLVETLKTRGARRTIAVPPDVVDALRGVVPDPTGLLFHAPAGGLLRAATAHRILAGAADAAGLGPVRPNELRHSAATHLCDLLPPHIVADILGHTTTQMIDATYRHRPAVVRGAEHA